MADESQGQHQCVFARITDGETVPHIENRFGKLESAVTNLTQNMGEIQRTFSENFKMVFAKIDQIAEQQYDRIDQLKNQRSGNTMQWVLIAVTILGLGASNIYQSLAGISSVVSKVENNLALANQRELQYCEDKGRSEQKAVDLLELHKELAKTQDDFAVNMREWRLGHQEANGTFHGETKARLTSLEEHDNRINDRLNKLESK